MKAEWGTFPKERQILHEILPLDTPLAFDLGIASVCNFKCNYCLNSLSTQQSKAQGFSPSLMTEEIFDKTLQRLSEFPSRIKLITVAGVGEPLLHNNLPKMISVLRKQEVAETIQIISNASLLTHELSNQLIDAGLQELRISLQGITSDKYKEISQVDIDFDSLYENIQYFSDKRGDCKLKVKIADTALERDDKARFVQLFGDICDCISVEHISPLHVDNGVDYSNILLPSDGKSRFGYEKKDIKVCWYPFVRTGVDAYGMMTMCCLEKMLMKKSVFDVGLVDYWNGQEHVDILKDWLDPSRKITGECARCNSWRYNYHPEDIIDGHERKVLERINERYAKKEEEK